MAIDVLRFNELKKQVNDYKCVTSSFMASQQAYNTAVNTLNTQLCTSAHVGNCGKCVTFYQNYNFCATPFPALSTVSSGLSVCDTSSNFNAGACCLWVAPGNGFARFQLWGAGGASAGPKCCGWALHGGTGAYASVVIPVNSGDTYTICSGCAWWPGAVCVPNGTTPLSGCTSFVTGPRLCNLCAEGGEADTFCWLQRMHYGNSIASNGICMFIPQSQLCDIIVGASGSPCICGDKSVCSPGTPSAATSFPGTVNVFNVCMYNTFLTDDVWVPCGIPSCKTYYGCTTGSGISQTCYTTKVYGIPGGIASLFNNAAAPCGCMYMQPVFPFFSGLMTSHTQNSSGGINCGTTGCLVCNIGTALPGMGGIGSWVHSACCIGGMAGKMGMVCVQFGSL